MEVLLDADEVAVDHVGSGAAVGGHLGGVVAQDAEVVGLDIDFDLDIGVEFHILLGEFVEFLGQNKKWWLAPIVISVLLLGALVLLGGTAAAPFIYTLF